MPGRGNLDGQQPDSNPGATLGGKIGDELRSALKLLFKNVEQQSVSLTIAPPFTAYITDLTCDVNPVELTQQTVQVSEDPIRHLRQEQTIHQMPLIDSVSLAADAPCHIEPALCKTPVLSSQDTVISGVSFENVQFTTDHTAPLEPLSVEVWHQPVEGFENPAVASTKPTAFNTQSRSLKDQLPKTPVRENPRLFALPIRKMPIPPHRFSPAIREIFRRMLAEKAETRPDNVQLKVVFERMNVAFYASIQQDEQGNLLCVPKNELIGKNALGKQGQALIERISQSTGNAYLVVGFRLDNKQDIRAMVPVDKIPSGPYTQKPDKKQANKGETND